MDPKSLRSACATAFSSVEKDVPSGIAIFCLVEKFSIAKFFKCMEDYNRTILITKEEDLSASPLCLNLGSSCSGGE